MSGAVTGGPAGHLSHLPISGNTSDIQPWYRPRRHSGHTMPLVTPLRRVLIALVAILGVQTLMSPVSAAPTARSTPPVIDGLVHFNRHTPSYSANDSNGRITGQVTYRSQISIAWSYRLKPAVADLATGFMHERADLFCGTARVGGYHDEHQGIPSSYLVHSSFRGLHTNCQYTWQVVEQFRVAHGGVATIVAHLQFVVAPS